MSSAPDLEKEIAELSTEHKANEVDKFFADVVRVRGSDLHLKVGHPPHVRVRNELRWIPRTLAPAEEKQVQQFEDQIATVRKEQEGVEQRKDEQAAALRKEKNPAPARVAEAEKRVAAFDKKIAELEKKIKEIEKARNQIQFYPAIDDALMRKMLTAMMSDRNKRIYLEEGGADFAYTVDVDGELWRYRVNILNQMGHMGLVARRVNNFIPNFEGLFLPPQLERLCKFDQGMILLAGVTGSGKSTTIASMLNYINRLEHVHILTLEDPIEFMFKDDKALINQREIGLDVKDFKIAMKHAVREDPDVMLVGEMRDEETFMTAIHAAETGHLVFGTIHASSAPSTIGRILDLFPQDMHPALRSAIAFNMRGIVAQKLLPSIKPGVPRVPTVEIMFFTAMIRKLILEEQDDKLADAIRIGIAEGMQDFTMSLKDLVDNDLIDRATAFEVAPNVDALKMALKGINVSQPGIL